MVCPKHIETSIQKSLGGVLPYLSALVLHKQLYTCYVSIFTFWFTCWSTPHTCRPPFRSALKVSHNGFDSFSLQSLLWVSRYLSWFGVVLTQKYHCSQNAVIGSWFWCSYNKSVLIWTVLISLRYSSTNKMPKGKSLMPAGQRVRHHLLSNYFHAILAVVLAQFTGLGFIDGREGVIRLAEASPYIRVSWDYPAPSV